ncbi:hypothetical protein WR25_25961 [Diploscapter pachys]|uniref:fatty acid amide hydrolase n=1 Tax=Diploscapter pachys TaxID=2018661 RepID=A0A2A2KSQ5_9BILA|nr:hypothetical protein WR25_25961 [Diploscapter pachys]
MLWLIVLACGVAAALLVWKWYSDRNLARDWLEVKVEQRKYEKQYNYLRTVENYKQLPEDVFQQISRLSFDELREKLQNGSVTASDTLRTYQRKAKEADEKTNCICLFFEEAVKIAAELDKAASNPEYVKPPLFGIPISLKENIKLRGHDSCCGFVRSLQTPTRIHSQLVKQLLHLGAVPFLQTNVPQGLLSYGCSNPVYGQTCHPLDSTRVPGGSSGGEGALISMGGSLLGFGTDIGGSIRTPCTFCGIAGFKPCTKRFSHMGNPGSIPGRQLVKSNYGPMAKSISICIEYLKLAWKDLFLHESDPFVPPVKWNDEMFESKRKLRIGYYTFDGFTRCAPAYERAVLQVKKKLEEQGHELIPFKVPSPIDAFALYAGGVTGDGGYYIFNQMKTDLLTPECKIGFNIMHFPFWVHRVVALFVKSDRMKAVIRSMPRSTVEMRKIFEKIESYQHNFTLELVREKIDLILCPSFATYPPHHGMPNQMVAPCSYTALYNMLDYPAGVVKVTSVTEEDEMKLEQFPEDDDWDKQIKQECKGCVGFPISVQIAAPPYREELCLRILRDIEQAFN